MVRPNDGLALCRSRKKLNAYLASLPEEAMFRETNEFTMFEGDRAVETTFFLGDKPVIRTIVKCNRSKGVVFIPEKA